MASTYSTSLKIQLIGNGEQSGVWGSTTNTNWNLMEQAVAGVVQVTMANADYTLSNLNGVSDEARNMVVQVGGTNSDVRKIVIPLVEKIYIIVNNTSGGYAITVGGATGSYATVPNGYAALVFCDASNTYSGSTTSAGNFAVNGNEIVSGNIVVGGNSSVGGNATVTANSTVGGSSTIIGSETVLGNLVVGSEAAVGVGATLSTSNNLFMRSTGHDTWSFANYLGNLYWHDQTLNTDPMSLTPAGNLSVTGSFYANGVKVDSFPSGTQLLFANSSAPPGWTQVTSDAASDRMIHVVNTAGGGYAGSNSPTVMDVVPSHTHGFTTGAENQAHFHGWGGTSTGTSNDHAHGGITAGNGNHQHGFLDASTGGSAGCWDNQGGPFNNAASPASTQNISYSTSVNGYHDHAFTTYGQTANHTHDVGGNTGTENTTHTHSGATNVNGGAVNWTPRYYNVIMCGKN